MPEEMRKSSVNKASYYSKQRTVAVEHQSNSTNTCSCMSMGECQKVQQEGRQAGRQTLMNRLSQLLDSPAHLI